VSQPFTKALRIAAALFFAVSVMAAPSRRARDWGIPLDGQPGPLNAITDVQGVLVGHSTIIKGQGKLVVGRGPIRTGVTAILPAGRQYRPVFAAYSSLNGNGEMTGTAQSTISDIENGVVSVSLDVYLRLLEALGAELSATDRMAGRSQL